MTRYEPEEGYEPPAADPRSERLRQALAHAVALTDAGATTDEAIDQTVSAYAEGGPRA